MRQMCTGGPWSEAACRRLAPPTERAPLPSRDMPRLEIKTADDKAVVPFDKPEVSIGRQAGNDIVIEDVKASRKHCVIRHSKGARFA